MRTVSEVRASLAVAAALLAACGGDPPRRGEGRGPEARDAAPAPPGRDAGPRAPADGSADLGARGGTDAGPPPDAAVACTTGPRARLVSDFGPFVAGVEEADAVAANTATVNRAIDEVGAGGGGTVCLPEGTFHLAPADLTAPGAAAIQIKRDGVTLQGAGAGRTILRTRSAFSLVAGKVVRGTGIRIFGTRLPAAPRRDVTLRDFELDGGAGYTGNFAWPANPTTGDGWDITHKGIVLSSDDQVDGVVLEGIHVHRYRGEVIYAGGRGLGRVQMRRIRSEDTNASTFNITADFVVEDSEFGKGMMWAEIGVRFPGKRGVFRRCRFHDAEKNGIVFAQGDLGEQPYEITDSTFESGGSGFGFFGGIGGPITIRNNVFREMGTILAFGYAPNTTSALNQKIVFEKNRIEAASLLASFGGLSGDVTVRDNDFVGRGGGMSTAIFYGSGVTNRAVVAENRFSRCRTPEQVAPLRDGERPLFRGNAYAEVERRELQGQFRVKPGDVVAPRFEEVKLVPLAAEVPIAFETARYPDGQEITVTGGTQAAALRCDPAGPSVRCKEPRLLRGTERLGLRFDAAAGAWLERAFEAP